jgi:hypothetical protein
LGTHALGEVVPLELGQVFHIPNFIIMEVVPLATLRNKYGCINVFARCNEYLKEEAVRST